jgi:hypothetical protein
MEQVNNYGKLTRPQLIDELTQVVSTLNARIREYGGLIQDRNNTWYPAYFRAPGTSVTAKEKEADYSAIEILNDIALIEADIRALTNARDCLHMVMKYGDSSRS